MEKVVCVTWFPDGMSATEWLDRLRGSVDGLRAAGGKAITVHLCDADVARGDSLHLGPEHPDAVVSWWTEESADPTPLGWIGERTERHAAYLVLESCPLVPPSPPSPGQRSPGFVTVACISPRADRTVEQFRDHWFGPHRHVALDTQATTGYVRNEIVRSLTPGAPGWAGIVEETFPLAALDDPAAFFDAVGDPQRRADHERRMFDSVTAFIDLASVERHPMSEYRLG